MRDCTRHCLLPGLHVLEIKSRSPEFCRRRHQYGAIHRLLVHRNAVLYQALRPDIFLFVLFYIIVSLINYKRPQV